MKRDKFNLFFYVITMLVIFFVMPSNINAAQDIRLMDIKIDGVSITSFQADRYLYSYDVPVGITTVNLVVTTRNVDDIVTGIGNISVRNGNNIQTINVTSADGTTSLNYMITFINKNASFDYTGAPQKFVAPRSGKYKIELWGAGASPIGNANSGKGAYTSGELIVDAGDYFWVYVGGNTNTFNGGNGARNNTIYSGGATDIRLQGGTWNDIFGLTSRLMVAGGGGSYGASSKAGGSAGALTGFATAGGYGSGGEGATQTAGGNNNGIFGIGGVGVNASGGYGGAGGGGYWGGGGASPDGSGDDDRGGGGGSSYVSGFSGCMAVAGPGITNNSYQSVHYSKIAFTNPNMIAGTASMPNPKAAGNITGNPNAGYVKITLIEEYDSDIYLNGDKKMTIATGEKYMEPGFTAYDIYDGDVTNQVAVDYSDVNSNVSGVYEIRYSYTNSKGKTTTVKRELTVNGLVGNYGYTGNVQEFIAPRTGKYKVELWGAGAGPVHASNGKGGFTGGEIELVAGQKFYVYVGGNTNNFNGGASSRSGVWSGGATDIRLLGNAWNNEDGLRSRLMVAGGGGTYGAASFVGTAGGGLTTGNATGGRGSGGTGAGQTYAGTYRGGFGFGGSGQVASGGYGGAGGGGYYGGGGSNVDTSADDDNGGAGGSSYISGFPGCNSVVSQDNPNHSGSSTHYSGLEFKNMQMLNGNQTQNHPTLPITMTGNNAVGYAKITLLETKDLEISLVGGASVRKVIGERWIEPGYSARDFIDGNLTSSVVVTNNINPLVPGLYEVVYFVQNSKSETVTVKRMVEYVKPEPDTFTYKAESQQYTIQKTGLYKIELWGANSSGSSNGAYTTGTIKLDAGTNLYFYVGGNSNTFNGGNGARNNTVYSGGATDVRLVNGVWNEELSLNSRIMVAAGAGSIGKSGCPGGAGGALTGINASGCLGTNGLGASQTAGGAYYGTFGIGGVGINARGGYGGAGGGGYFGGGSTDPDGSGDDDRGGGSGSSYISGYSGCIAIKSATDRSPKTDSDSILKATHYSGYTFINSSMVAGNAAMPNYTSTGTMTGNAATGYAKITLLEQESISIKLNGDSEVSVMKGDSYVERGATAEDIYEGDITSSIVKTGVINTNVPGTYYISYSATNSQGITASIQRKIIVLAPKTSIPYNDGKVVTYTVAKTGMYRIETWGAQGNDSNRARGTGGNGGYARGAILLEAGTKLYFYVGEHRGDRSASFNAGSIGGNQSDTANGGGVNGYGGGGATDVRLVNGAWNDSSSLRSRIMVAGGGGGASDYAYFANGGVGGGLNGGNGFNGKYPSTGVANIPPTGGSQTTGGLTSRSGGAAITGGSSGTFGVGGDGNASWGSGGGGGYYGGAGGGYSGNSVDSGAGGSSFVSGLSGADALNASGVHTGQSEHYSGYVFSGALTIPGNEQIPDHNGTSTMIGNTGNGFAKITLLTGDETKLESLSIVGHNFTTTFLPNVYDYYVTLPNDAFEVEVQATAIDPYARITGKGTIIVPSGTSTHEVIVHADDGTIKIYTIHMSRPASSFNKLNNIKIDGISIEGFLPTKYEYNITATYDKQDINIEVEKGHYFQTISGDGIKLINSGLNKIYIMVTPENGGTPQTYTLNVTREHTTLLDSLVVQGEILSPAFDKNVFKYKIEVFDEVVSLSTIATAIDTTAKVQVVGGGYLKIGTNYIQVIVTEPSCYPTVYDIEVTRFSGDASKEYDFPYKGEQQEFIVPTNGSYKIELWGAGSYPTSGKGGYTVGEVKLNKNDKLYIYTGGNKDLFNGNANSGRGTSVRSGGATDVRLVGGIWNDPLSLRSRIMVAGGGGSYGVARCVGAAGGNTTGTSASGCYGSGGTGGSQTAGGTQRGTFGQGGNGISGSGGYGGAGGGGYFGGGGVNPDGSADDDRGGGGGSSFISGFSGCNSVDETGKATNQPNHYSNIIFTKANMINGNTSMPNPTGGYMTGNANTGYARITLLKPLSSNNKLAKIEVNKGTLTPTFNPDVLTYDVDLSVQDVNIIINAKAESNLAVITGLGTQDVLGGTNSYNIAVTAENGDIRIYTVNVTRPKSSDSRALGIEIYGLTESLCSLDTDYCVLDKPFEPSQRAYSMLVPSNIKSLTFDVTKAHKYQKVEGAGLVQLEQGQNNIIITITSEDGNIVDTYLYVITRELSANTNLSSLTITDPVVNLQFNKENTEYFISVAHNVTELALTAIAEDDRATVTVEGNADFVVGLNVVTITVRAANGETKNYILNVTRQQTGNNYLSSLELSHAEVSYPLIPNFNKTIKSYSITVPNEVNSIDIIGVTEDPFAIVTGLGTKPLNVGSNTFTVNVTAQNGDVGMYTVTVNRAKSGNNYLNMITSTDGILSPAFDKEILEYTIDVNAETTQLNLNIIKDVNTSTYVVKNNSNLIKGLNTITIAVTAENGTIRNYIIKAMKEASNNNYLSSITTNRGSLNEEFNKDNLDYTITVDNSISTIVISATKEYYGSTLMGTGTYQLAVGDNTIRLNVLNENNETRTYTITITRQRSMNANLFSITNNKNVSFAPAFNKNTLIYTAVVSNEIKDINIFGLAESLTATVSGNGTYQLATGLNTIDLIVTAEDGVTSKTYTINITRNKSTNADIESIIATEASLNPVFNSNITTYDLKVQNDVLSLTLDIKTRDPNATYSIIGNSDFVMGSNSVKIKVTSEEGALYTKTYTLNVVRQAVASYSNDLVSLTVNKGTLTPIFHKNIQLYTVTLPNNETTINIAATKEDADATVTGTGLKVLNVGQNIFTVTVISKDNIQKDYQIVVIRQRASEARLRRLDITGVAMEPSFSSDVYNYRVETTSKSLALNVETLDSNATYEIIGNGNFAAADNTVIVRVTAEDGTTKKDYTITATRSFSNNNNLSLLEVENYTIMPSFDPNITLYELDVDADMNSISVIATAEDSASTIIGTGFHLLNSGINNISVEVRSESGRVKTYIIVINKDKSDNNYLSNLIVSSGQLSPIFHATTESYDLELPYETDTLTVTGIASDSKALVSGNKKYNIPVGTSVVSITVTSESGILKTYTIHVTRARLISSKIKTLTVVGYPLNNVFNSDTLDYSVTVPNEVLNLNLNVTLLDDQATYEVINNSNFIVGMNVVTIRVTASDSSSTTDYMLNVTRQLSSNNFLTYIGLSRGSLSPTFSKTVGTYTVNVANDVTSIAVDAAAESTLSTVEGLGTYNLNTGTNEIVIKVTSAIGVERFYRINVIRAKEDNNLLSGLVVKSDDATLDLIPDFSATKTNYVVNVLEGTRTVDIIATKESGLATITGTGIKNIVGGVNLFNIVVTSESGQLKTYTVTVNRPKYTNNFLTELVPSSGSLSPAFSYYETNYTINIQDNTALMWFDVSTENEFATVTGYTSMPLIDGVNTRVIKVMAENGSVRTYTITINKHRMNESRLLSLSVLGYNFQETFDRDVYDYHITVPNSKQFISHTEITGVPINPRGTVSYMGILNLDPNRDNIYTVKSVAEDGFTTTDYRIHITRAKGTDATLSSLSVNGYELNVEFFPTLYEYTITVPRSKVTLDASEIIATTNDPLATIEKMDSLLLTNGGELIYTVKVTSNNEGVTNIYKIRVLREPSSNNYLNGLSLDKGTLIPTFDKNIDTYNVSLVGGASASVNIVAIAEETGALVVGAGAHSVPVGISSHNITVTAENGDIRIYTINFNRILSNNNYLTDILVSSGTLEPSFDKNTVVYDLYLGNNAQDLTLAGVKEDESSSISGEGTFIIPVGDSTRILTVTSESGTVRTYTIHIHKSNAVSLKLRNVEITGLTQTECNKNTAIYCNLNPTFDPDVHNYTLRVPFTINRIGFNVTKDEVGQIVTGAVESSLLVGSNERIIKVKNANDEESQYVFTFIRDNLVSSTYIRDLTILNHPELTLNPIFTPTTQDYRVDVPNSITNLEFNIALEDMESTYTITGNNELFEGRNDVIITVRGTTGTSRTYTIQVNRALANNTQLSSLSVSDEHGSYSLSPIFDKFIKNYRVTVPNTINSVTIAGTADDPQAIVSGLGERGLTTGSNVIPIMITATGGQIDIYYVTVIREKATNAYLSNIVATNYPFNEAFVKTTFDYTLSVPFGINNIELNITKEDPASSYTVVGNRGFVIGNNLVKIIVISEDGNTINTYNLHIVKEASNNNYLSSLTTNKGTFNEEFNKEITSYTKTVTNDVTSIKIMAESEDPTSIVTGQGVYSLEPGENMIPIAVTSQSGLEKIYTIHITRETNDNNYLVDILTTKGILTPIFNRGQMEYVINVPNDVTNISLTGIKEDLKATVTGNGNYALNTGENIVNLKVVSESGKERIYKVRVLRDLSENANLKYLFIHEGNLTPVFDKNILNYSIKIPNEYNVLTIDALAEVSSSTVEVVGNQNLKVGNNTVTIKVTSESSNAVKEYHINVIRQTKETDSNYLISLSVNKGTIQPTFNKLNLVYDVTVAYSDIEITVSAVRESPDAKITGTGTKGLQLGMNLLPVVVTSKDGIERTYTIRVYRQKSNDARIKTLSFDEGLLNPTFNRDTYSYTINIASNITGLNGYIQTMEEESTYVINGNKNFVPGINPVSIVVTAPDGITTKTYTVLVNKLKSNNNYLLNLTDSEGKLISFNKTNIGPYMIEVDSNVNSIYFDGVLEDSKATVTGLGSYNLNKGVNTIQIKVTSESNIDRVYTVIVNRTQDTNNLLSTILLSDGSLNPTFNPATNTYQVTVPYEATSIQVLGFAQSSLSSIQGNGTYNLVIGANTVNLIVTSESGSVNTYTLTITRDKMASSKLLNLSANEGPFSETFQKNNLQYSLEVPYEVTSLTLNLVKEDVDATHVIIGNDNFIVGMNEVKIRVTDHLGQSVTEYKLYVTRQVSTNNFLSSLTVDKGTLTPVFDKNILSYTMEVENNVTSILVSGTAEDSASTVFGMKAYNLTVGNNLIEVGATSASGVKRTYKITVIRKKSSDNFLNNIIITDKDYQVLSMDQTFNKTLNNYTITVATDVNSVIINATKSDTRATVTGLGTVVLSVGTTTRNIVVTAEDGTTNTYTITISRGSSSNHNILNIVPSSGSLVPEFNNNTTHYDISVNGNTSLISFAVTLEDSKATVTGNGQTLLHYGENNIILVIKAEDGTEREVTITVTRTNPVIDITPSDTNIMLNLNDFKDITLTFNPTDATNQMVIWESENEQIATVSATGRITAVGYGTTNITVTSVENPTIKKYILVEVVSLQIESDIYIIDRDREIVIGSDEMEEFKIYVTKFKNRPDDLKFYTVEGELIDDMEIYAGTGMIIKLVVNNITHDELRIVVRGDCDGNGIINVSDSGILEDHILKKAIQVGFTLYSMELQNEDVIDVTDSAKLEDYVLKRILTLN